VAGSQLGLDKTGMVDVVPAHQLVRAIPAAAALVLVGDFDQLPSVGPGCSLRDTAITKGRKLVVIVGSKKAVAMAVKWVDSRRGATRLRGRMKGVL
jgi:ATP-dependent exoDNAse (exonuclease V) alpha subunit